MRACNQQKSRSRAAAVVDTDDWVMLEDDVAQEFIGYDLSGGGCQNYEIQKSFFQKRWRHVSTCFQYDSISIRKAAARLETRATWNEDNGNVIYILDTKKENNLVLHYAKHLPADPSQTFKVVVDRKQRFRTMCNHTATHLLHQALRTILGRHVEQKGSAVHSKNLRFDFSHFSKLTEEEIKNIELFVNLPGFRIKSL